MENFSVEIRVWPPEGNRTETCKIFIDIQRSNPNFYREVVNLNVGQNHLESTYAKLQLNEDTNTHIENFGDLWRSNENFLDKVIHFNIG